MQRRMNPQPTASSRRWRAPVTAGLVLVLASGFCAQLPAQAKVWAFPPGASCPSPNPPAGNIAGGPGADVLIRRSKEDKNCQSFEIWCIDGAYFGLRFQQKNMAGMVILEKWVGICPYTGGINSAWVCVQQCPGGGWVFTGSKYRSVDGGGDDDGDGTVDSVCYCFDVVTCQLDGEHKENGVVVDPETWGPGAARPIPGDPMSNMDGPLELLRNMPSDGDLDGCANSPTTCTPTTPLIEAGFTTGTPGLNDMTINGMGSGTTSFNLIETDTSVLDFGVSANAGDTLIWVEGTPASTQFPIPGGFALELSPFSVLVDPFSSIWLGLMTVPPSGNWNLTLTLGDFGGMTTQFGILTAAVPTGLAITQAHSVAPPPVAAGLSPGLGAPCNPAGIPISLTDDDSQNVLLSFPFNFYGVTYNDVFIGSNGYLTFGNPDTGFSESEANLLNGPPRISMWWDDLSPNAGGNVSFFDPGLGFTEVCFNAVPEFGPSGSNDFLCVLDAAGIVIMDWGAMSALDGLVGMSPGITGPPFGFGLDLTLAPHAIPPGASPFELFTATNPNDLIGLQAQWILDPAGFPVGVQ